MMLRRLLTCCLLVTLIVGAQQAPAPNTSPAAAADQVIFRTSSQLVIETVGVRKNGMPVEGLTAKDFIVTEDGMPQTISIFEYQKLPEVPSAPLPADPIGVVDPMP